MFANKAIILQLLCIRLRGATVARLTPDQKVACSNHVGVILLFWFYDLVMPLSFYPSLGGFQILKFKTNQNKQQYFTDNHYQ